MPLLDFDKQETWDSLYSAHVQGIKRHFVREAKFRHYGFDGWALRNALNLKPGQRIAVIGGAFGWMVEDWEVAGLGPIITVDTSKWIHAHKAREAVVPILNADVSKPEGRAAIAQALGGPPDLVITEDVLAVLSDPEVAALLPHLRTLGPVVAHWVSCGAYGPGDDKRLNWKTAQEWKALVSPDLLVARGTSVAL